MNFSFRHLILLRIDLIEAHLCSTSLHLDHTLQYLTHLKRRVTKTRKRSLFKHRIPEQPQQKQHDIKKTKLHSITKVKITSFDSQIRQLGKLQKLVLAVK